MGKMTYTILALMPILLLFQATICTAEKHEKRMLSSTEEIVTFWDQLLSDKLDIVVYDPEKAYWYVNRIIMVNQSFGSDVSTAVSDGTPGQLIIHFSCNRWDNRFSPNANSAYQFENRSCGFKSVDDALASRKNSDFKAANYSYLEKISRKMRLVYILKNEAWVLKGGNDLFEEHIGQFIADKHNAHLFRHFLAVPIK
ncbi:MAG: hypothetical protein QNJ22_22005 [Desulfosarcinaceae bacterium]|nr:hypothetical protein [Desulfosarcinaceae bacterium]